MTLSSAEIFSPERYDSSLGDGWEWSERHLLRVQNDNYKLYVQADALWLQVRNSNQGAVCITNDNEPEDFPVIKMVMLTRSDEAMRELIERFIR